MSIKSICTEIAQKIHAVKQKGYEEGYAAGQEAGGGGGDMSAWWDAFFANQQELKTNYAIAGAGWHEGTFKPNRTINAEALGTTTPATLFSYTGFVTFPAYLEDGVTPILDTKECTQLNSLFSNCKRLEKVLAPIDLSSCTNMSFFLAGTAKLKEVTLKHVEKVTNWSSAFGASTALTDIGQDSDDFGYFSASVDLSKTKIDFGTDKMSLASAFALSHDPTKSFLKVFSPDDADYKKHTLTVNGLQEDDANKKVREYVGAPDDYPSDGMFEEMVTRCGWLLGTP